MKLAVNVVCLLVLAGMTWASIAWEHAALSAFCGLLLGVQILITVLDLTSDVEVRDDEGAES